MEHVLVALGVLAAAGIASAAGCAAYLRRRVRINPKVRSAVPVYWLWSVHAPARAHRRLRRAVRGARAALAQAAAAGMVVDGLSGCLQDLEAHALAVDDQIIVAARFAPLIRRSMLRGLRPEVTEIEFLSARVAAAVVSRTAVSEERLADVRTRISQRLDALDAASAEIAALETRWHTPAV